MNSSKRSLNTAKYCIKSGNSVSKNPDRPSKGISCCDFSKIE